MNKYVEILEKFNGKSVLVLGDVMLDRYVWGEVNRVSPEAPIPIVHILNETHVPGGAGNAANNLAKLGAAVHLVSITGDDVARKELIESEKSFIDYEGLITNGFPTIVKQRVVADKQHLLRMDFEATDKISDETVDKLLAYIEQLMPRMDILLISDYSKYLNVPRLMEKVIELANQHNVISVVDSKSKNYKMYRNATVFTPNHHDAARLTGINDVSEESIIKIGNQLASELNSTIVMTRGREGISIFSNNGDDITTVDTKAKKVYDISGAGDTVASVIALSLSCGASMEDAANLASYAAAAVIAKVGTATTSIREIKKYIEEF